MSIVWLDPHQGASCSQHMGCEHLLPVCATAENRPLSSFLAAGVRSGSTVKMLEAYVYSLFGFVLHQDLSLGHVDASAFIKSTCNSLQDLNCVFLSLRLNISMCFLCPLT